MQLWVGDNNVRTFGDLTPNERSQHQKLMKKQKGILQRQLRRTSFSVIKFYECLIAKIRLESTIPNAILRPVICGSSGARNYPDNFWVWAIVFVIEGWVCKV
jgi:hypothetical protein